MSLATSPREKFLWVVALASAYAALSFLWSAMGFASPVTPAPLGEYSSAQIVREIGGHLLFGVLAALPTMDAWLVLLSAGESILIDVDHILGALGFHVAGRLAHSVFFALAAAALLACLSARIGRQGRGGVLRHPRRRRVPPQLRRLRWQWPLLRSVPPVVRSLLVPLLDLARAPGGSPGAQRHGAPVT
ncbi:MAG: hypothetical protein JRN54_01025 [Nitrososphaerota archaeon]|nr:hypothetical protein [Nitrososphaerota archaeon]